MEITVSFAAIAAMGVAMGVCLAFPFGFIIYNRKRMMLLPIVAGLAGYLVLALFLSVAREAIINAAKHAGAARLTIDTEESGDALRAVFKNDGRRPRSAVQETGGLFNLRQRVEKAGGQMQIDAEPEFRLTITIPKGGTAHAVQSSDR